MPLDLASRSASWGHPSVWATCRQPALNFHASCQANRIGKTN
jgi:hypothetical protein